MWRATWAVLARGGEDEDSVVVRALGMAAVGGSSALYDVLRGVLHAGERCAVAGGERAALAIGASTAAAPTCPPLEHEGVLPKVVGRCAGSEPL